MNIISHKCSIPLASTYLGLICCSWENSVLLPVHTGLTSGAWEKTLSGLWIRPEFCFGLLRVWKPCMSPVWTEAPKFSSALCLSACVPQCMSVQAGRYLGAFPKWIWSAGSQLLSPVTSHELPELHLQQYGGLEGKDEEAGIICALERRNCIWSPLYNACWPSFSAALSVPGQLWAGYCHAVTGQPWRCTFPCTFPDARLLLLRETFSLAWPAQDLHWSVWGHGWCTRCQLWSIVPVTCPAQGSSLHHPAEIRKVPDLCAH